MKLRCKLFGHIPAPAGWWGDIPYAEITQEGTDGIGRIHGSFWHKCHRCKERFRAGRLHLNGATILKALEQADET